MRAFPATLALAILALSAAPRVQATEGGIGRPITGMQAASYSGLIPPTPGFSTQFSYLHYGGDIGASRETPVGGGAALGLDVSLDLFLATGIYIWDTGEGRWNFASMLTVPFISADADADYRIGTISGSISDSDSGLFDAYFAPVIASYHIDEMRHVSLAMYIYAPTGSYEAGRLVNPGLNTWTFSPTVGYTHLFQQGTLEWSTTAAVDFYTENDDTDYQNGAVFRVDSLLVKRTASGWGYGGVAGWIQQVEDDEGGVIASRDGFKGRALGLGPIVTYAHKWDGGQVEFGLRYVNEFNVRNRPEGDGAMLTASLQF
ncbi:transporter [Lysobacter sp. SG-8]|uniref:Transporter n=1 Tax=Marilutibacter penaei TaxID=2759900 RepID=A0A7W3YDK4_9GAMM|nr:transporter [Lysobacter penaei]MBB1087241.1 transporter [Lysobacter penaei]